MQVQRHPSAQPAAALAARVLAIVFALLVAGLILAAKGANPFMLAAHVVEASFGSRFGLEDLGVLLTPLILTGLSVAVALRIGAWNIGADGQLYFGAFAATGIGLFFNGPPAIMLAAMFVAGAIGGAVWIFVPTFARAYAGVSELITTLLLNFVAVLLVYYVATGPWLDPAGHAFASTARIRYEIPEFWGAVGWGFPIAILITVLVGAAMHFTRWGYEVRFAGSNPHAAKYAGIPFRRHLIAVMLLSGAIAGIAGMLEVAGTAHRLQGGISNNYGYIGIMVAVLARGSSIGVLTGAALMAVILDAGIVLQTYSINVSTVVALTGFILFLTAIGDELAHYRIVQTKMAKDK